jgi:nucleoside 2-deoxyribosyltransferase
MTAPEKLSAFVLMPFEARFGDVYHLGIKAAVEELGMIATRVDEQIFHKEAILERIYNQIGAADFIIADMSGRNANVFYEVGYAHAKQKTCILLTADAADIPFDLKHRRHIVYGTSISDLKQKLITDLAHVKAELEADQIRIVSQSYLKLMGTIIEALKKRTLPGQGRPRSRADHMRAARAEGLLNDDEISAIDRLRDMRNLATRSTDALRYQNMAETLINAIKLRSAGE